MSTQQPEIGPTVVRELTAAQLLDYLSRLPKCCLEITPVFFESVPAADVGLDRMGRLVLYETDPYATPKKPAEKIRTAGGGE